MGLQESGILTAVAIDKDKNSQHAVKWATEKLPNKSRDIILVHVLVQQTMQSPDCVPREGRPPTEDEMQNLFLPFRGFCARKGVAAKEVILVGLDVASALSEYICACSISNIVLGASSRSVLTRAFRNLDVPSNLGKSVPDFCSVYAVSSRGRVQNVRSASRPPTPSICSRQSSRSSLSLPDTPSSGDFSNQGIWRSSGSSVESFDGGSKRGLFERKGDPWDSLHASKNPLPPQSANYSNDSTPRSQWESMSSTSSSSSAYSIGDNTQTVPYSRQLGSRNMTSRQSVSNGSELLQATSRAGNSGSKIPSPAYPVKTSINSMQQMLYDRHPDNIMPSLHNQLNNINLRGHTRDTSFCSSTDSELSGPTNYSSNVSSEQFEHSVISDASGLSISSASAVDDEEELKRLRQELKRTLELLNEANKQANTAKQTVREINELKSEEMRRLEDSKLAQEAALVTVEREKRKSKAAVEMAQRMAELESQKQKRTELKFPQEAEEKTKSIDALTLNEVQYRRYTIEEIEVATNYFAESEKIGEGGYGPVYKAFMDRTAVAIKVLRPDISQGHKQFQREIEVLSRIRHPNMVLLLGACDGYGCLVYEYMENGSLDDRLFRKNNTPPIPWDIRFKISAEIATTLHFLHQTKPAPLVHRDLKPANILLDRNNVSKISDVGLARLVPPSVADRVTQYQVTAAAGTFCYIDPEYQKTGKLSTKSDIYSLGVLLLQIITARPPIGLTHHVGRAIEEGNFADMLDPAVSDWPVQDALSYANLALKCCELTGRDRPDLGSVILPELERLRDLRSRSQNFPETLPVSQEVYSDSYEAQMESH